MRLLCCLVVIALLTAEACCMNAAIAKMIGMVNYTDVLSGTVFFEQLGNDIRITGSITGLAASGYHGFHIHQSSNLSSNCMAAGPHYNPLNQSHGGLNTTIRHVGDLGNVMADNTGTVYLNIMVTNTSLMGTYGVINRTITIHEDSDDLGLGNFPDSQTTGHSGRRIGCGVIMVSSMGHATAICYINLTLAVLISFLCLVKQ